MGMADKVQGVYIDVDIMSQAWDVSDSVTTTISSSSQMENFDSTAQANRAFENIQQNMDNILDCDDGDAGAEEAETNADGIEGDDENPEDKQPVKKTRKLKRILVAAMIFCHGHDKRGNLVQ